MKITIEIQDDGRISPQKTIEEILILVDKLDKLYPPCKDEKANETE